MTFVKFDPEYGHILKFWLAHDSWHVREAFALFVGVNPDGDGLRKKNVYMEPLFSDVFDFDMHSAETEYEKLHSLWWSGVRVGRHESDNEWLPPSYFIQWAIEKKIEIPWLEWALMNGLIDEGVVDQAPLKSPMPQQDDVLRIHGPTFSKLQRAVIAFPERYPRYRTHPPKLDEDVRPWLKEEFKASDAVQRVFGAILREHFQLSADTSESQS